MNSFDKKKLLVAIIAGTCLISMNFMACSQTDNISNDGTTNVENVGGEVAVSGSASVGLWRSWNKMGVSDYFDSLQNEIGSSPINTYSVDDLKCRFPALAMDGLTERFDELENIFQEGFLVKGVCGKALNLKDGQVAPLGIELKDSIPQGTVEFWFRPGNDFYDKSARTLLGNDESRLHFFMKDGMLIFQKNHADRHFFVEGNVKLNSGWNKIAGQWGDGYMSLWLNDSLVARKAHTMGYAPSLRDKPFGNLLVIGYKSHCCMEATGQYESMTTSGAYDQVRISRKLRYDNSETLPGEDVEDSKGAEDDSLRVPAGNNFVVIH